MAFGIEHDKIGGNVIASLTITGQNVVRFQWRRLSTNSAFRRLLVQAAKDVAVSLTCRGLRVAQSRVSLSLGSCDMTYR
jgi:hypothetical protein